MKPVCVYSSPRVGSTALSADLASKYNIPNLSEIFNNRSRIADPHAVEMFSQGEPFVWAFKPLSYTEENRNVVDQYITQSTVVKLTRKDLAAQIVSYYLMVKTRPLEFCVNIVNHCNKLVDDFDKFDQAIVYEEHIFTDTCGIEPAEKPNNYNDLLDQTKYILTQKGIQYV